MKFSLSVGPFVWRYVRSTMQDLRNGSLVFLIFCIQLERHKIRKLTEKKFWQNVQMRYEVHKSPTNWSKMRFPGF